jgi:hypothetical protein
MVMGSLQNSPSEDTVTHQFDTARRVSRTEPAGMPKKKLSLITARKKAQREVDQRKTALCKVVALRKKESVLLSQLNDRKAALAQILKPSKTVQSRMIARGCMDFSGMNHRKKPAKILSAEMSHLETQLESVRNQINILLTSMPQTTGGTQE